MATSDILIVEEAPTEAREVFLAWEKLRLVYNGVLVAWVLFLLNTLPRNWPTIYPHPWSNGPGELNWGIALLACAISGLAANICYLLGPAAEAYALWLGMQSLAFRLTLRIGLFSLGLGFTALMALIYLMSQLNVGFDVP